MVIVPLTYNLFLSGANRPGEDNTNQSQRNAKRQQAYKKAKQLEKKIADLKKAKKPVPPELLKELAETHAQWNPFRALETWEMIINTPDYANYKGRLEVLGKYIIKGYRLIPAEKHDTAILTFLKERKQRKGELTPQEKQLEAEVLKIAGDLRLFYARLSQSRK